MNIVLLEPEDVKETLWVIHQSRQYQHIIQHLKLNVGDRLKVGIRNETRYLVEIKKLISIKSGLNRFNKKKCLPNCP